MEEKKREIGCALCELVFEDKIITKFYTETEYWYVVDCKTCNSPMAVLKQHTNTITVDGYLDLVRIWNKFFMGYELRFQMRMLPEHLHFHFMEER